MDIIATKYTDETLLNAVMATNVNRINQGDYRQVRFLPPDPTFNVSTHYKTSSPGACFEGRSYILFTVYLPDLLDSKVVLKGDTALPTPCKSQSCSYVTPYLPEPSDCNSC